MNAAGQNDDATAADTSMISNSSPYQPTTEPVANKTSTCGGFLIDVQYVKSLPGILKLVEILLCIIVLICLGSATCSLPSSGSSCSGLGFLRGVAIWSIVFTIILYFIFLLTIDTKVKFLNWPLTDLINTAVDALFFLISGIVTATQNGNAGSTAAVVFGFFCVVAYSGSAWFAYRACVLEWHKRKSHVTHIAGVES